MISINTILIIIASIGAIFGFGFLRGKMNEKIKQTEDDLNVYKQAKNTKDKIDSTPDSAINDLLDKLYDKKDK